MTVADQIHQCLRALSPDSVELIDESAKHAGHAGARDGGGHYRLRIVATCFNGLGQMARHRMVYDALGALMRREIHALSISAFSPSEL